MQCEAHINKYSLGELSPTHINAHMHITVHIALRALEDRQAVSIGCNASNYDRSYLAYYWAEFKNSKSFNGIKCTLICVQEILWVLLFWRWKCHSTVAHVRIV